MDEEILNAVAEKTVLELVELISAFEEKFNVSAAAVAENNSKWILNGV
jgi:large subunit ribosomal protein L7/L12